MNIGIILLITMMVPLLFQVIIQGITQKKNHSAMTNHLNALDKKLDDLLEKNEIHN